MKPMSNLRLWVGGKGHEQLLGSVHPAVCLPLQTHCPSYNGDNDGGPTCPATPDNRKGLGPYAERSQDRLWERGDEGYARQQGSQRSPKTTLRGNVVELLTTKPHDKDNGRNFRCLCNE